MKPHRYLPILALAAFASPAKAQFVPGKSVKEYTTKLGTTFRPGDTIYFALGRRESGAFKYAAIPPGHLLNPEGGPLAADWANRKVVVTAVRVISYKTGPKASLVFKSGVFNAAVDVDAAEQEGEIITSNNKKAR